MNERTPYTVVCSGLDRTPGTFPSYAAARSYALGVANREDVQCALTDRFGNTEIVIRTGPVDPLRREYDPYRWQRFFHPNPEHPRSRERFLRNEPQAWTPGMGPAQTQIRPQEFFDVDDDQPSLLSVFVPPLLLLGVVGGLIWSQRRRDDDLGDGPDVERARATYDEPSRLRVNGKRSSASPGRRSSARKLYGSAVLAAQAAGSMRKLALETRDREIATRAVELQRTSRQLLDRARTYDPGFVQGKLSV